MRQLFIYRCLRSFKCMLSGPRIVFFSPFLLLFGSCTNISSPVNILSYKPCGLVDFLTNSSPDNLNFPGKLFVCCSFLHYHIFVFTTKRKELCNILVGSLALACLGLWFLVLPCIRQLCFQSVCFCFMQRLHLFLGNN